MKHFYSAAALLIAAIMSALGSHGQTISIGPDQYAFQFTQNTNYGLFFNATDIRYDFRNGNGFPVFGINANTGRLTTNLQLENNVEYYVQQNRFIYRSPAAPASGLYYGNNYYEFRAVDGQSALSVSTLNERVGIGLINPSAQLHLLGTGVSQGSVLFVGAAKTWNTGPAPASGAGTRFMWYADKASLRAGRVNGNQWDGQNIGMSSVAMGYNTTASGENSTATGFQSIASGASSFTAGAGTVAPSYSEIAIGHFNTTYTPVSSTVYAQGDRLLSVGNGTDATSRSNAMVILKNGNVGIGNSVPSHLLNVGNTTGATMRIGSGETIEDGGTFLLDINATIRPKTNNSRSLGNSEKRWSSVFATNGTINTSDAREKNDVTDLTYGMEAIHKLRPVSYRWNDTNMGRDKKIGLIAQELLEVIPEVVMTHELTYDDEKAEPTWKEAERLGVFYSDLIPVLVKGLQEVDHKVQLLEPAEVEMLRQRLDEKDAEIAELKSMMQQIMQQQMMFGQDLQQCCFGTEQPKASQAPTPDKAHLGQNVPNPFRESTMIQYYLPQVVNEAIIRIISMEGTVVRDMQLPATGGFGQVEIHTGALTAGTYVYTLFVDGALISSRKMIVIR